MTSLPATRPILPADMSPDARLATGMTALYDRRMLAAPVCPCPARWRQLGPMLTARNRFLAVFTFCAVGLEPPGGSVRKDEHSKPWLFWWKPRKEESRGSRWEEDV